MLSVIRDRFESDFERFDFSKYSSLTFEQPDTKIFRNLALSYEALRKGGNWPCILNAANEVAVEAFLKEKIGFLADSGCHRKHPGQVRLHQGSRDWKIIYNSDLQARRVAQEQI